MKLKIIIFNFLLISSTAFANPVDDMGEVAGAYYGSCISLNFLKNKHCSNVSAPSMSSCVKDIEKIIPTKYVNELRRELPSIDRELKPDLIASIDSTYKKVLSNFSGDKEKACLGMGSMLNTLRHQKLEELKRIAKYVK
jgi:hypothetical protein